MQTSQCSANWEFSKVLSCQFPANWEIRKMLNCKYGCMIVCCLCVFMHTSLKKLCGTMWELYKPMCPNSLFVFYSHIVTPRNIDTHTFFIENIEQIVCGLYHNSQFVIHSSKPSPAKCPKYLYAFLLPFYWSYCSIFKLCILSYFCWQQYNLAIVTYFVCFVVI